MQWAEPAWLALLILCPLLWLWERSRPRVAWPTLAGFVGAGRGGWARVGWVPTLCLSLAIAGIVVAMARPRTVGGRTRMAARGTAIVVAVDRSSSMKAADFVDRATPKTRLDAAKSTLDRFVAGRPDDLIGVVAFANYPDLTCPPTLDHAFARRAVAALSPAVGPDDGTNLGDALVWSLDTLKKAPATSRVLILLSDGRNDPNVPKPFDPLGAARLCRELGITLHTVAVGDAGGLVREREPVTGLDIINEVGGPDLVLLAELARLGGGKSFRATDAVGLAEVFAAIDAMEKSPVSGTILTRYDEHFAPWAAGSLACLISGLLLRGGRLARLP